MTSAISDTTSETDGQPAANTGPIPMSFPAALRASNLTDRFACLGLASASDEPTSDTARVVTKRNKREDQEGKRWIRRKENCMFHHQFTLKKHAYSHIVRLGNGGPNPETAAIGTRVKNSPEKIRAEEAHMRGRIPHRKISTAAWLSRI